MITRRLIWGKKQDQRVQFSRLKHYCNGIKAVCRGFKRKKRIKEKPSV